MSNDYGMTVNNLMRTLPDFLKRDEEIVALAESIAEMLSNTPEKTDALRIYARVDELPEELLDILAYDFKIDWWDPNYTVEQKKQTLTDSWDVHRTLGTKHAVETAVSAIYPDSHVTEWFEYGGDPFSFTLHIDSTFEGVDPEKHRRVLDRLEFYKNVRSQPYRVEYTAHPLGSCVAYAGTAATHISGEISINVEVLSNAME